MQVVIDISKEKYDEINSLKFVQYGLQSEENKKFFYLLINAIQDGIPLPEDHGDIGDFDEALKCIEETSDCDIKFYAIALIEWAMKKRVIIEANKE